MKMYWQKYAAEFTSTCVLTLTVLLSLDFDIALLTPLAAAMTVGLFVYTIGDISGAHINPAVTLGLWSIKKIDHQEAMKYVASQLLGSFFALAIFRVLLKNNMPWIPETVANAELFGELVGTFILVFGVCAVVHKNVEKAASGLVIGGSLFLGIIFAISFSNGVLNPAVAFGIGALSISTILGPLGGGVLAAWLYRWLCSK